MPFHPMITACFSIFTHLISGNFLRYSRLDMMVSSYESSADDRLGKVIKKPRIAVREMYFNLIWLTPNNEFYFFTNSFGKAKMHLRNSKYRINSQQNGKLKTGVIQGNIFRVFI